MIKKSASVGTLIWRLFIVNTILMLSGIPLLIFPSRFTFQIWLKTGKLFWEKQPDGFYNSLPCKGVGYQVAEIKFQAELILVANSSAAKYFIPENVEEDLSIRMGLLSSLFVIPKDLYAYPYQRQLAEGIFVNMSDAQAYATAATIVEAAEASKTFTERYDENVIEIAYCFSILLLNTLIRNEQADYNILNEPEKIVTRDVRVYEIIYRSAFYTLSQISNERNYAPKQFPYVHVNIGTMIHELNLHGVCAESLASLSYYKEKSNEYFENQYPELDGLPNSWKWKIAYQDLDAYRDKLKEVQPWVKDYIEEPLPGGLPYHITRYGSAAR